MFKPKFILTFHMNSGDSFKVKCEEYSFTPSDAGIASYSIKGIKGLKNYDPMLYVNMLAIERIEVKQTWW